VILAFVSGEDDAFFEHSGVDIRSILRAAYVNFTAGEIEQGASTITQQLVKSMLLTPERSYDRKLKEMLLARRIEQHLEKDEILSLYLNQIYFGSGAWGIGEAARTYFGKSVGELTVGEGALLAGLPKAPSRFSPNVNPARAEERRRYVLGRMHELGHIDEATWRDAVEHPPAITGPPGREDAATAAWFTEEVRRVLYERLGGDTVLRGGLRIETTLDLPLQAAAQQALRQGARGAGPPAGLEGPAATGAGRGGRGRADRPRERDRAGRAAGRAGARARRAGRRGARGRWRRPRAGGDRAGRDRRGGAGRREVGAAAQLPPGLGRRARGSRRCSRWATW
jgi:penicillin-binding protein 1A